MCFESPSQARRLTRPLRKEGRYSKFNELPELWIGQSGQRKVLCKLRNIIHEPSCFPLQFLPGASLLPSSRTISNAQSNQNRKLNSQEHRNRMPARPVDCHVLRAFLHQILFRIKAPASVYSTALLTGLYLALTRALAIGERQVSFLPVLQWEVQDS